ncbi:AraC family transcriptional regulator [Segnochrobactrum spirostomi]|uniref:AraC family transcriptional regulator n=1 Tax=Segnochrobactrum spirostomi TaxID=2608987 RepID=UPI001FEBE5E4|nr:AraC family transcriptional regulator [Segnochrobactrum spirostomi]
MPPIFAPPSSPPRTIGFLLLPGFPLMSYASAVEPLRGANHLSERTLYRWCHVAIDGAPIEASNGIRIAPDAKVGDAVALDALFVCAGGNPALFRDRKTFAWLRRLARDGLPLIAGMSGGPFVLARAGLLAGGAARSTGSTFRPSWRISPISRCAAPSMRSTATASPAPAASPRST